MILDTQACEPDAAAEAPEIVDPLTGELVDPADHDALIDLYERCRAFDSKIYVAKVLAAKALAAATSGDTLTRRLVTKSGRKIKIEMPGTFFENSVLKEAWHSYPQFREQYLRIGTVEPQLREVKKLRNTTCDSEVLETFKKVVLAAEKPSGATPRITVEK